MLTETEVRNVIIAEAKKLPEDLCRAQSPYVWAIAVKKLLLQGRIAMHMKIPENGSTQVDTLTAIEQLDLAIAHHYLREKFAISVGSFASVLLLQILHQNDLELVLERESAQAMSH